MLFRNVPLALLSGLVIVALVYLAMNIAYFAVLDVETVKASNAVAAVSGSFWRTRKKQRVICIAFLSLKESTVRQKTERLFRK